MNNNDIITDTTVTTTESININGVEYSSIDDVPEPHRSMLLKLRNGDVSEIEKMMGANVNVTDMGGDNVSYSRVTNKSSPGFPLFAFDFIHIVLYGVLGAFSIKFFSWLFS